jgi:SAM-dependent methyltransferase
MQDIDYKHTFNNQADLYNEARPKYPAELFSTLTKIINLPTDAHLLEIGPGTGQATKPFAEKDYSITAVEPGGKLVEVFKKELRNYDNVQIITNSYEDVELPTNTFDLVYVATAFHWLDPEIRFKKTHSLLKSGCFISIIRTCHILSGETKDFFDKTQPIYNQFANVSEKAAKSQVTKLADIKADILDTDLFKQVYFKVFPMRITYTSEQYIKLLSTFSEVIAMNPGEQTSFLEQISNLIKNEFGGKIVKEFGIPLTIGRKIKKNRICDR